MTLPFATNALFGLGAALCWGGGDFGGGMGVKRLGSTMRAALLVVLIGHGLSLAFVATTAHFAGSAFPHGAPLWWGLGGGVLAALSLVAFYIALSDGHMGSAAALSGLLCAAVPAVVSAWTEGAPGYLRIAGFALAAIAIWRIAAPGPAEHNSDPLFEPGEKPHIVSHRTSLLALLGGLGFGFYFVALKYAGTAGVLWPMATARIGSALTSAVVLGILTIAGRHDASSKLRLNPRTLAWIIGGATLDSVGNMFYIAATRAGRLDVAAVIAALYPASTILLAAWLLRERTTRRQMVGMLLALPAVVLIAR
jgi:drug/metabolite transporter (DMT)-like permease